MNNITNENFYEKEKELLEEIPKEFRGFVSYSCYEDHHSSGYDEVYFAVKEMIYNLKPCIEKFIISLEEKVQ